MHLMSPQCNREIKQKNSIIFILKATNRKNSTRHTLSAQGKSLHGMCCFLDLPTMQRCKQRVLRLRNMQKTAYIYRFQTRNMHIHAIRNAFRRDGERQRQSSRKNSARLPPPFATSKVRFCEILRPLKAGSESFYRSSFFYLPRYSDTLSDYPHYSDITIPASKTKANARRRKDKRRNFSHSGSNLKRLKRPCVGFFRQEVRETEFIALQKR